MAKENSLALKGGTAINLFVRDMPRLSVDIDLTHLNWEDDRATALQNISDALGHIEERIKAYHSWNYFSGANDASGRGCSK